VRFVDRELQADAVAGWLAGHAGDEPAAGAVVASLLGCGRPACAHPAPEARSFAYLSGHAEGLKTRIAPRQSIECLRASGLLTDPPRRIRAQGASEVDLVKDPDENSIELEVAA
jgi:hypothetical protein